MIEKYKESSALAIMQRMIEKYSLKTGKSFEKCMNDFSKSETYKQLFDFDNGLWSDGPDYLLFWYEEELKLKNARQRK